MPAVEPSRVRARLSQAYQLIARLERISVNSVWAHRSSGYRGSLLKWIEQAENSLSNEVALNQVEMAHFEKLMDTGLRLLEKAAQEKIRRPGFQR